MIKLKLKHMYAKDIFQFSLIYVYTIHSLIHSVGRLVVFHFMFLEYLIIALRRPPPFWIAKRKLQIYSVCNISIRRVCR